MLSILKFQVTCTGLTEHDWAIISSSFSIVTPHCRPSC